MKDLRWIYAGSLVGLAGVIALAIAAAPSRPTAGTLPAPEATPSVAVAPAPTVVATGPVAAKPARIAPAPAKKAVPSGIVPGSAGLLIGIDPETGQVGMPTPEQVAEMQLTEEETVSKDAGGILVRHPGGMMSVDLQGRSQEYGVTRKTVDGKTVIQCVEDPKHAHHIQPAPAAIEEE